MKLTIQDDEIDSLHKETYNGITRM